MPTSMTIDGSTESKSEVASEVQLDVPALEEEADLLHQMYGLLFLLYSSPYELYKPLLLSVFLLLLICPLYRVQSSYYVICFTFLVVFKPESLRSHANL